MKTFIISLFLLFIAGTTFGQTSNDTIVVAPGETGMYFYHVVEKGESLQSLSRQYNLSDGKLAAFNQMSTGNRLKPYEFIKIPINKNNLVQTGSASDHTGLTPLYHKILKGETLFRVGKLYGDIPLASIREWNHLQGNTVKTGQYLIVGWLKKQAVSAPVAQNKAGEVQQQTPLPVSEEEADPSFSSDEPGTSLNNTRKGDAFLREVITAEKRRASEKPANNAPVSRPLLTQTPQPQKSSKDVPDEPVAVSKPLLASTSSIASGPRVSNPVKEDPSPELQKTPGPKEDVPDTAKADNPFEKLLNEVTHKPAEPEKTMPPKPAPSGPDTNETAAATAQPHEKAPDPVGNYTKPEISDSASSLQLAQKSLFSELYLAQTQNEKVISSKKGAAGWFKSNVKPGSKKYYALCDELPRGTIVKVINPINKKYVYVKVLAPIPEQKENYNLIIKLSDAAMNDLGTNQPRFWSKIVFPKVKGSPSVE